MRNLYDWAYMSFKVAALLFQMHAIYWTWSIDFAPIRDILERLAANYDRMI